VTLIPLAAASRARIAEVGAKAARLGELVAAGFAVPPGVVVPAGSDADPAAAAAAAIEALGDVPLAVRSSAAAEDGDERSLAGRYTTVLGARGAAAVAAAIAQVRAGGADVAVLIQPMIAADRAGVAFTADPVSGDRDRVVVEAVTGTGDRLTAGDAAGDPVPEALAARVAAVARAVATRAGAPQDLEWAAVGDEIVVLQARPMTALPDAVAWTAPAGGAWLRNFRFGEWLPGPPTPLFATWLLARADARAADDCFAMCGFRPRPPLHVLVHGWYFTAPFGAADPRPLLAGAALRRPGFLWALARHRSRPELIERRYLAGVVARWRGEQRPRYEALIARGAAGDPVAFVDAVADAVAEQTWSLIMGGGSAWKLEGVLARFCRRHLAAALPDGHQVLLRGLVRPPDRVPDHAVHSLDWFHPTAGELGAGDAAAPARFDALVAERERAEATCRAALGRRRGRFDRLLDLAQRYAIVREEQAAALTLAWPAVRRAVAAIGADLAARAALDDAGLVWFATRDEIGAPPADLAARASARRRAWQRQRRLAPPLVLGRLPGFLVSMLVDGVEAMRTGAAAPGPGTLVGAPASPGRARGVARVVRDPAEAASLRPGEVLVAPAPTPALAAFFARAAALVTDGGSAAAHASIVAREHGIPAVVATGDATRRLRDGQLVTVDGSAGVVEIA